MARNTTSLVVPKIEGKYKSGALKCKERENRKNLIVLSSYFSSCSSLKHISIYNDAGTTHYFSAADASATSLSMANEANQSAEEKEDHCQQCFKWYINIDKDKLGGRFAIRKERRIKF